MPASDCAVGVLLLRCRGVPSDFLTKTPRCSGVPGKGGR